MVTDACLCVHPPAPSWKMTIVHFIPLCVSVDGVLGQRQSSLRGGSVTSLLPSVQSCWDGCDLPFLCYRLVNCNTPYFSRMIINTEVLRLLGQ